MVANGIPPDDGLDIFLGGEGGGGGGGGGGFEMQIGDIG